MPSKETTDSNGAQYSPYSVLSRKEPAPDFANNTTVDSYLDSPPTESRATVSGGVSSERSTLANRASRMNAKPQRRSVAHDEQQSVPLDYRTRSPVPQPMSVIGARSLKGSSNRLSAPTYRPRGHHFKRGLISSPASHQRRSLGRHIRPPRQWYSFTVDEEVDSAESKLSRASTTDPRLDTSNFEDPFSPAGITERLHPSGTPRPRRRHTSLSTTEQYDHFLSRPQPPLAPPHPRPTARPTESEPGSRRYFPPDDPLADILRKNLYGTMFAMAVEIAASQQVAALVPPPDCLSSKKKKKKPSGSKSRSSQQSDVDDNSKAAAGPICQETSNKEGTLGKIQQTISDRRPSWKGVLEVEFSKEKNNTKQAKQEVKGRNTDRRNGTKQDPREPPLGEVSEDDGEGEGDHCDLTDEFSEESQDEEEEAYRYVKTRTADDAEWTQIDRVFWLHWLGDRHETQFQDSL